MPLIKHGNENYALLGEVSQEDLTDSKIRNYTYD